MSTDQTRAPEAMPPFRERGSIIGGKLQVERIIGQGAMGVVYLATDLTLARRVAVKVILPELLGDDRQRRRFEREARATASLSSEHAVRVLDVNGEAEEPYLVMEYLEGRTVQEVVLGNGPVPAPLAADWMLQALDAIAEAHAQNLVHRDVKPGNLFLADRRGREPIIKVLDFGMVKDLDPTVTRMTKTGAALGSPAYMAPEQVRAAPDLDARADVWSIGATLYEMLTGKLAFDGAQLPDLLRAILEGQPEPLRKGRPHIPEALERIVNRCLAKDRNDRYDNAADVAEAVHAAVSGPGATVRIEPRRRAKRDAAVTIPIPAAAAASGPAKPAAGVQPVLAPAAPLWQASAAPRPEPPRAAPVYATPSVPASPPRFIRAQARGAVAERPHSRALVFITALLAVVVLGALAIVAILLIGARVGP